VRFFVLILLLIHHALQRMRTCFSSAISCFNSAVDSQCFTTKAYLIILAISCFNSAADSQRVKTNAT
jgi:hypothetical protein